MRPQGFRGVAHLQIRRTTCTAEDQLDAGAVLGQPSHATGHDVASFWSSTDGECERQHTEKPATRLFTIAQIGKIDAEDAQQGILDSSRRGTGSPTLFLTVRHDNARWSVSRKA